MGYQELKALIIASTLVFLTGPVFIFLYVATYFKKRKGHMNEKLEMRKSFDAELLRAQMEVREQTMETIGADLHDNVGQLLSLSAVTLNAINPENIPNDARDKIESAVSLTKSAIAEMRLLGKLLQGEQLISFGLKEAIGYEVDYLSKLGVFDVVLEVDAQFEKLPDPGIELILFRIMQEGINNIIKHASAKKITITLKNSDDLLILTISDDGRGFEKDAAVISGMGLLNINKRAAVIGGEALINSVVGQGTTLELKVPYGKA
ncbi:sensor histidine kinase [Pedobacter duraquae]|uniref:Oxygen sensor histidine kinase NreB n=1 Tax=Pedobacter duraquae TaxID=425511 RepID=A0A4R6INP0_9SPHI|nr:sensor histidine kinase [Pedobacter duraquae]TDO23879.1 signal transduction histidine kinase [Pedobacter duraquae]